MTNNKNTGLHIESEYGKGSNFSFLIEDIIPENVNNTSDLFEEITCKK